MSSAVDHRVAALTRAGRPYFEHPYLDDQVVDECAEELARGCVTALTLAGDEVVMITMRAAIAHRSEHVRVYGWPEMIVGERAAQLAQALADAWFEERAGRAQEEDHEQDDAGRLHARPSDAGRGG